MPATQDLTALRASYDSSRATATRFANQLYVQVCELADQEQVTLGFPVEKRVKTWESFAAKMERGATVQAVTDLSDYVGLRLILLFLPDREKICRRIEADFDIIEKEDTQARLGEAHFGYSSIHYVIRPPATWRDLPGFRGTEPFKAEIQVRTVAQHIWAAASHFLQYKQEAGVPEALRRAVNRVSALLEIVDLEFQRVLEQRDIYRRELAEKLARGPEPKEELNVELLENVLNRVWPEDHKFGNEDYGFLLEQLQAAGIKTVGELMERLHGLTEITLRTELEIITEERAGGYPLPVRGERALYSHAGLTRLALRMGSRRI